MRRTMQYLLLLGALAGILSANSVLTCSVNGNAFSSSGCLTSPSFFTTSTTDWLTALGPADQAAHNVVTNGTWQSNNGAVTVGLTEGPGHTGSDSLLRVDNFASYYDPTTQSWRAYTVSSSPYRNYNAVQSFFDAPPDSGAGGPGDHLVSTNGSNGPLEIQFSQGISGVMFRISTPTSADVIATISAYSQLNPTSSDIPLRTYTVHATNAGGTCATLANPDVPVPCNVAPYIGIENLPGNIRSVVVSTTDPSGMYIGSLYLNYALQEVPEPGTFVLFGGALVTLALTSRRRTLRS